MKIGRRWGVVLVGTLGAVPLVALPFRAGADDPPPPAGPLAVAAGQPVFATYPTALTGDVADEAACTPATCPTWEVDVPSGGTQLRVGVDTPSREDGFEVQALDPSGAVVASATASNQFDDEAFVDRPVAGRWTVRVLPQGATDAPVRIRVGLDEGLLASAAHPKGTPLLPNLKAVPPMELGFIAPANPLNGLYPPDDVNPPLDVAGVHPLSCAPDEAAPVQAGGQGAKTCLRLTTGPINVGEGPFDMRFDLVTDTTQLEVEPNTLRGPMRQAVHLVGGGIVERPAGTYSFHTTHGHFHTEQILTYELFKVTDAAGSGGLTKAGAGTKSGFCPADQLFGDFLEFQQAALGAFGEGDTAAGGCSSPDGGSLGLTMGWGDVYRWQRPGQYVEFGGQADGFYVVRATVDIGNLILESNDADNASYALARITGEDIELIERGQGSDPWDPAKTVFCGAGPASRDAFGPRITTGPACDKVSAASATGATSTAPMTSGAVAGAAPGSASTATAGAAGRLPATGRTGPPLLALLALIVLGLAAKWAADGTADAASRPTRVSGRR